MTFGESLERIYGQLLRVATGGRGVAWRVDDRTTLRIDPRCRWIRNQSYEVALVDYLRAHVAPGDCCAVVGAHVGYHVLQLALWTAPGGRVIAFEPNPLARDVLETNVRLNGFGNRIAVEPLAVSDVIGTAPLFHGSETSGLSRIGAPNPEVRNAGTPVDVRVVTLDDYCGRHAIVPRWVLVDTEGQELHVLEGARGLLANPGISFVIEMHPDLWPRGESTGATLERLVHASGRTIVPLTRQSNPLGDYGIIAIP